MLKSASKCRRNNWSLLCLQIILLSDTLWSDVMHTLRVMVVGTHLIYTVLKRTLHGINCSVCLLVFYLKRFETVGLNVRDERSLYWGKTEYLQSVLMI